MNLDFETYSEAGTKFNLETGKWSGSAPTGNKKGIGLVGAYVYAEHPSTEVTVACYSADGGKTVNTWRPGDPAPKDLLDHAEGGGLITAWNSFFEWSIWNLVCVRLYGWPPLPIAQTRDSMAVGCAWSLPSSLANASEVVFGKSEKDATGKKVMLKLSQPRNATKGDYSLKHERSDTEEWRHLDSYCAQDVRTEANIAALLPPLTPSELEVWKLDQVINGRGVMVDIQLIDACIGIMEESRIRFGRRLAQLTMGKVTQVSQATALLRWVNDPNLSSLTDLQEYLDTYELDPVVAEVLEIRRDVGGSAPAKLISMRFTAASDGRVRGIYQYSGAQRTRRWAGRGVQPQNMYNPTEPYSQIEQTIPALSSGNYEMVEALHGNPAKVIANCLRSMLISAPEKEFISSDFSAIEAVVMACMAGEQWIVDVFNEDGKLYERTGSKITGTPVEEIDKKHPARKIGKVASLASQFQGARGAWLKFGAGKFLTNKEIDKGVRSWREAAPSIVAYWYAVEAAAINAVRSPGAVFKVHRIDGSETEVRFQQVGRALYCVLPGQDWLTYLDPEIQPRKKMFGEGYRVIELCEELAIGGELRTLLAGSPRMYERLERANWEITGPIRRDLTELFHRWEDTLTYCGVGPNHKWVRTETYGGKLAENITQATARFILSNALINVEAAGYPIVMHTHDEIVSEVPDGFGSVEEYERIMSIMPTWAHDWPIKAAGGWRGKRFRK